MENEKKYFLSEDSMLDADSADFVVTQNSWVNAENVRMGSTDAGVIGTVESIGSNNSVYELSGNYLCVGNATDEENERFVTVWKDLNGNNDKILCTYTKTNNTFTVLEGEDVFNGDMNYSEFNLLIYFQAPNRIYNLNGYNFTTSISVGDTVFISNSNLNGRYTVTAVFPSYIQVQETVTTTLAGITYSLPNINIPGIILGSGNEIIIPNFPQAMIAGYSEITQIQLSGTISQNGIYSTVGGLQSDMSGNTIMTLAAGFIFPYNGPASISYRINSNIRVYKTSLYAPKLGLTDEPLHSCRIVDRFFAWTDYLNNQPRIINIDAGIKLYEPAFVTNERAYELPILSTEITIIKKPPVFCPNIVKGFDTLISANYLNNDSFQFAYQYVYYDNTTSVIGGYSVASRINPMAGYKPNYIDITMDALEKIPSTVRLINIICRIGDGTRAGGTIANIVKFWDKRIASDLESINKHNNGEELLTYRFLNDRNGEFVPSDDVLRPFDNVPIYSKTLETAKNRIFLANNVEGYDVPTNINMSVSVNVPSGALATSYPANRIVIRQGRTGDGDWYYQASFVYLPEGVVNNTTYLEGYYLLINTEQVSTGSFTGVFPALTVPISSYTLTATSPAQMQFKGATYQDVLNNTKPTGSLTATIKEEIKYSQLIPIRGTLVNTTPIFLPDSTYNYGIVYYDQYMRKCGVVRKDDYSFKTPRKNYDFVSSAAIGASWTLLGNTNIPEWAYYYAPVLTMSQRTSFFVASASYRDSIYVTLDQNGDYIYNNQGWDTTTAVKAIGINTNTLNKSGLGYVYNQGDYCKLITKDSNNAIKYYELQVTGQQEEWILLEPINLGVLAVIEIIYEIYTPYKSTKNEPFYEIGEIYKVNNPTKNNRSYSVTTGKFNPDIYAVKKEYSFYGGGAVYYYSHQMSPNEAMYKRWDNDGGKLNFITDKGTAKKRYFISWSDSFIPDSSLNGLNSFRLGNEISVPQDCGEINKLQLTSKIQQEGTVMLSICTSETNSMYLGETQIVDSTGAVQFFSANAPVISTINTLKGSFGTINPESVVEFRGRVYYADANKGVWVQYAENGLSPISNYKMTRFWKRFFAQYLSMTKAEIEALGSRPYIFSGFDSNHLELLISIPRLLDDPPKGYLPDYPAQVYPFDIWDGQSKTIVYCTEQPYMKQRWQGSYSFCADNILCVMNKLYTMKGSEIYEHNQLTWFNEFYGINYPSRIMVVANQVPQRPKVYNNISVESNMKPSFVYFYNDYPYLQTSDLEDIDFKDLEGVFYATLYRNKIVPIEKDEFTTDGLLTGEKMRNVAMKVMLEFEIDDIPLELKYVNFGYQLSRGHTT